MGTKQGNSRSAPKIAIIGSGPAGLMAADRLSSLNLKKPGSVAISLFDKRRAAGRKLLVAGSSGLNVSNSLPVDEFITSYRGATPEFWKKLIGDFPPESWCRFIEDKLGSSTFEGTSGRFFVEEMKASKMLQAWISRLKDQGVELHYGAEVTGWDVSERITLRAAESATEPAKSADLTDFDGVLFALGGGSWEPDETPLRWPEIFKSRGVAFDTFAPANAGFQVKWPEAFLKEAEGKPIKTVALTSPRGTRKGELMVTRYGLEGTPVYSHGVSGPISLDLKPDLTLPQLLSRLRSTKENLAPIRRVGKFAGLGPAAFALVFHLTSRKILGNLEGLAARVKNFPLELGAPRPLSESISSSGGLQMTELDPSFMLKRHPGIFACGEMLNWDAPTGGYLIQACVSQGRAAADGISRYLGLA